MNKSHLKILLGITALFTYLSLSLTAFAAVPFIPQPIDLPPESIQFDGPPVGDFLSDPNILAAFIGVTGLIIGSMITILATYFMRWMDNRREDKREDLLHQRSKHEKELQIKQEIYKNFLDELAHLETFPTKTIDEFRREWTKSEVKVDLIASKTVREIKEELQQSLLELAEQEHGKKEHSFSAGYLKTRELLLDAIREDIDILQSE